MSTLTKKKQEKNQETIRKLSLMGDNKECADCVLKSTPYVVLDFGIFVCTFCSGVHRGFNYKAKGISMTNFEDKDVEFLETHGNKVSSSIWRAKWDPNKVPKPKSNDEKGIKDFINKTYVQKMWYDASGAASVSKQVEEIPVRPIESIGITPAKVEVRPAGKTTQQKQQQDGDLFSFEPVSKPQPTQTQQTNQSGGLDFDFGFTQPTHSTQNVSHLPQSSGFSTDDNWGFDQPAQQKPTQTQQKASINVDDLFAGFGSSQPQQTQGGFGGQQQGGWGQSQGGFGGQQSQPQGWGQQSQQGGFGGQQGWGQQTQGGFGGQPQGGFGGQQGWGQQTQGGFGGQPQGGFGGQQQWGNQQGFGGHQTQPSQGSFGGQQGGFGQGGQQGWGQQPQGGFGGQPTQQPQGGWGQPQPARNLQVSPPPVNDPFSNLTSFGSSTTKPSGGNNNMMNNNNPFDF